MFLLADQSTKIVVLRSAPKFVVQENAVKYTTRSQLGGVGVGYLLI